MTRNYHRNEIWAAPENGCRLVIFDRYDRPVEFRIDLADVERVSRHQWTLMRQGSRCYAYRKTADQKNEYLHQYLCPTDGKLVDHRDRDTLNYCSDNLRPATTAENNRNRRKPKSNKSGYLGVTRSLTGDKWVATITTDRRVKYLGTYADLVDAAIVRDLGAIFRHGDFASLNFPVLAKVIQPDGSRGTAMQIPAVQEIANAASAA